MYPKLSFMLVPYTRLELPGWGYLLSKTHVLGYENDRRWAKASTKIIKGKWHGYKMRLNLAHWSDRMTYFLGRYYELNIQLLLDALLEPGDRMIDIGANIGMITLHASALVKESGMVESFEPNPECVELLNGLLEINKINHVTVRPVGLSDTNDRITLSLVTNRGNPSYQSGIGTFASINESQEDEIFKTFEVEVCKGDEMILRNSKPVKFIKIDVEGFELHVLLGLQSTLNRWRPPVVMECIENHLRRAKTSQTEINDFMKKTGYRPYGLTTYRQFLKHRLRLIPIIEKTIKAYSNDVLWVHRDDLATTKKIERFIHLQE